MKTLALNSKEQAELDQQDMEDVEEVEEEESGEDANSKGKDRNKYEIIKFVTTVNAHFQR